jgi:hypothetical protein
VSDFGAKLTSLFDEVAATIDPRPDFESVLTGQPQVAMSSEVVLKRPVWQTIGFAAAAVTLVGGSVFALDAVLDSNDGSLATSEGHNPSAILDTPGFRPPNSAAAWPAEAPPSTVDPSEATTPTTTAPAAAVAPTSTVAPQQPIARLGPADLAADPIKQPLYGIARPYEKVVATSPYGEASTRADRRGEWSLVVHLRGVPGGSKVAIVVTLVTSGRSFTLELERPPDPVPTTTEPPPTTTLKPVEQTPVEPKPEPTQPAPVEFTADLGSADLSSSPMKQYFYGTGTPGSTVWLESAFGYAETVVGGEGYWELKLKLYDVPVGTAAGVLVTNSASPNVFEFWLQRQEPPPPAEIEFSANAAFTECDSPIAFNEYWGKSTVGATITISSPYGSGQATANEHGKWEARIEFPGAPTGETFLVTLTSSKSATVFQLPMVSTRPA